VTTTTLANPGFGAATEASPSIATCDCDPALLSAAVGEGAAGTVTRAVWRNNADTARWVDSVGTSAKAINLSNNVLAVGEKIELTAYTFSLS
jgi:hypothetical protein